MYTMSSYLLNIYVYNHKLVLLAVVRGTSVCSGKELTWDVASSIWNRTSCHLSLQGSGTHCGRRGTKNVGARGWKEVWKAVCWTWYGQSTTDSQQKRLPAQDWAHQYSILDGEELIDSLLPEELWAVSGCWREESYFSMVYALVK